MYVWTSLKTLSVALHFNNHSYFAYLVSRQQFPIDKYGGTVPFTMNQYKRMFNSCQIPKEHKDELHYHFKLGMTCKSSLRIFTCSIVL